MASSSSPQRVIATYSGPPGFLTSPDWASIREAVRRHLPLKNLHWKPASRPSIRTIQLVDVEFKPLDMGVRNSSDNLAGGDGRESMMPGSFLEKPFLNIFFVNCENGDLYKSTVKKQIKDWQSLVIQRKNQEWLIVLVTKPDPTGKAAKGTTASSGGGGLFGFGGSVLDKIRSDFNIGKRDRCVQLWRPAFPNPDEPGLWTELISKMKDGIVTSFDANVTRREEETKAMEGMRTMPGWNFCTFFVLKESLAHSFEGMNLFEDAMLQYDELEASFFQVLKERNLSWFGKLGGNSPLDDSASILSVTQKPYRDLILANSISVFDFRIYVFARQCRMLGQMGRVSEVLKKGVDFVKSFGRTLGENPDTLAENFLESWMFSSCMHIIDTCDEWRASPPSAAPVPEEVGKQKQATIANKAELYLLARQQLDKLGLKTKHLPDQHPFNSFRVSSSTSQLPDSSSTPATPRPQQVISRRELAAALESEKAFDILFQETTDKAIDCYLSTGKDRATLELVGSLAALDLHRGRLQPAYDRYSQLSSRFAASAWPSLQAFYLIKTLTCHRALEADLDARWIEDALALLGTAVAVEKAGRETIWEGDENAAVAFLLELVEGLKRAGKALDKERPVEEHAAFDIKLASERAFPAAEEDGCSIELQVTSLLPCTVVADDIRACLSGSELEQLWFTSGRTELSPGLNIIRVTCLMPVSGLFSLESAQVRLSRVALNYRKALSLSPDPSARVVVRVAKDLKALDATVSLPLNLRLDSQPVVLLEIKTGRNQIGSAVVSIRQPEDEISFDPREARLESGASTLALKPEGLIVESLGASETVVIAFPYRGTPRSQTILIRISIDYFTEQRPTQRRAYRKTRELRVALPFAVNVQDLFREGCLFSKFTLSSDGYNHLRVASTSLVAAESTIDILSGRVESAPMVVVAPRQPGSFLFKLTLKGEEPKDHGNLLLTVKYRTLMEELRHMVESLVKPVVAAAGLEAQEAWLVTTLVASIDHVESWAPRYMASGVLDVPDVPEADLDRVIGGLALGADLSEQVKKLWNDAVDALDAYEAPLAGPDIPWRTLEIPVDVPVRQIVSAVRLSIAAKSPLAIGQPVSCLMSISTSSRWSGSSPSSEVPMCFDLGAEFEHWLVSGRKKGTFIAKDGETFTLSFTLIPVHSGSLFLPRVLVQPVSPGLEPSDAQQPLPSSETFLVNAAEKVEVLPMMGRATFVVQGAQPNEPSWERGWKGRDLRIEV